MSNSTQVAEQSETQSPRLATNLGLLSRSMPEAPLAGWGTLWTPVWHSLWGKQESKYPYFPYP